MSDQHGTLHRSRLPALPARRHEAVPQGRPLLHRQVRLRAPRRTRPASTARRGAASCRTTARSCARSRRCKRIYGLLERQFRGYYHKAIRMKGVTGENLLSSSSAASTTWSTGSGFASDRAEARQLVRHGHFRSTARGSTSRRSSCKPSDQIEVKERVEEGHAHPREPGRRRPPRRARSGSSSTRTASRASVTALPAREDLTHADSRAAHRRVLLALVASSRAHAL